LTTASATEIASSYRAQLETTLERLKPHTVQSALDTIDQLHEAAATAVKWLSQEERVTVWRTLIRLCLDTRQTVREFERTTQKAQEIVVIGAFLPGLSPEMVAFLAAMED
jgi:hypothetical protein